MAETAPAGERPDAELIRSLEAADIHPLWDRYQRITPIEPNPSDTARVWRWRDFEPFTARAAAEVPVADVERRALIMANPDFGGATMTTNNLLSAFIVLEPGDRAVPHRHTTAAIRFSTRAEGAATIVNGRRCDMMPGDLILTPPMCWHGHINDSDHRITWFDAANIPLMNTLDAHFFEPGSRDDNAFWQVDEGDERLWDAAGLMSEGADAAAAHSPKYRYPGEATRRLLAASAPGADGSRVVRYVNPVTGGSVMTTLDCYAVRLPENEATRARRGAARGTPSAWWSTATGARRSAARRSSGRATTCSRSRIGHGPLTTPRVARRICSWSPTGRCTSASTSSAKSCSRQRR